MNMDIKLIATGLVAALITSIIGLTAIALFGQGTLAEEIASSLKIITGMLAAGLIIDLGVAARSTKKTEQISE